MIRGLSGKRLEVLIDLVKTAKGRTNAILEVASENEDDVRPSAEMREALDFLEDRRLIAPCGIGRYRVTRAAVDVVEELDEKQAQREKLVNEPQRDRRKVFIIYGRNDKAFAAVRDFVRALGLEASDFNKMVEARGGSPYVGEVIAEGMREMQAMVAVFTPDERAELREQYHSAHDKEEDRVRWQARPNVLFEAGMAMGIDEKRTILVTIGKVSLSSDLDGRHVVRMSNSPEARDRFKGRLKAVDCDVREQADWTKTGDFDAAVADLSYDAARPSNEATTAPAVPATMSDDAAEMRLVVWLRSKERTPIASGEPVELSAIDKEAGIPPGSAERLIGRDDVLQGRWEVLAIKGGYVQLTRGPAYVGGIMVT